MRTKITFNDLCVKVAEHLGYEDEVYDGDFHNWFYEKTDFEFNDSSMDARELLLSPEGCDLLEQEAKKLGFDSFSWRGDTGRFEFTCIETGEKVPSSFSGEHKNKHAACILAFSRLVGVSMMGLLIETEMKAMKEMLDPKAESGK